jgi:hypothetical protein
MQALPPGRPPSWGAGSPFEVVVADVFSRASSSATGRVSHGNCVFRSANAALSHGRYREYHTDFDGVIGVEKVETGGRTSFYPLIALETKAPEFGSTDPSALQHLDRALSPLLSVLQTRVMFVWLCISRVGSQQRNIDRASQLRSFGIQLAVGEDFASEADFVKDLSTRLRPQLSAAMSYLEAIVQ